MSDTRDRNPALTVLVPTLFVKSGSVAEELAVALQKSIPADDEELRLPAGLLLVATLRGDPIGCGALKFHDGTPAELKRMWVADSARGFGVGRRPRHSL